MSSRSSSVWIRCQACGHTTRALAVMTKRVLAERHGCPTCRSMVAPILQPTSSGANISFQQWQLAMAEKERMERGDSPERIPIEAGIQGSWGRRAIRQVAAMSSQLMQRTSPHGNKGH